MIFPSYTFRKLTLIAYELYHTGNKYVIESVQVCRSMTIAILAKRETKGVLKFFAAQEREVFNSGHFH